ncbi:ABC transporter substrate-binding protein [Pusillimonas noertemannii]|uniref:ABC transporter substrate-binding protein n=1 Tax=Pusillimonas noertemannii TaxID=305977 RepID=UPI0033423553
MKFRGLWDAGSLRFVALALMLCLSSANAADKVKWMYAALPTLPAYGVIQLAIGKGYFADENIEIEPLVGKGGVDVAKHLGAGNADMGMILADGPILVRPHGIPVKAVAAFGGKPFMQLAVREDAQIESVKDLKGKTISVMSLQDTTFYALQGALAAHGLDLRDVEVQPVGPANVWRAVASGQAVACACVPDWVALIENEGVALKLLKTEDVFPSTSQAVGVSDDYIKSNPDVISRFIKAALRAMKDIMDDPEGAAAQYVEFVPEWQGKEAYIKKVFTYYASNVYPGQATLGALDPEQLKKLQEFYISSGIVQKAVPIEDLYTNRFLSE